MASTSASSEPEGPVLIGIDWGSSNLRAALLDASGGVIERRESPAGVFALADGGHAHTLFELCGDWIERHRVPLLACGMIGSRQGIVEVPYVACPTDVSDLARALGEVDVKPKDGAAAQSGATLYIVPGLTTGSDAEGWDVMRGEETQLMGLDAPEGALFVLPGTHSKWVRCAGAGRLESFQTYLTGELFDLLRRHGSLARVMSEPQWSPDAFRHGVAQARDDMLENLLFRVRTAGLMGQFAASALSDYLSGLLIGAEVKAGLRRDAQGDANEPVCVVGNAELTQRYAIAFASFGLTAREIPGDTVFRGLLRVARHARLLRDAAQSS